MAISVDTLSPNVIYGASGVTEVIQNVRTIITTRKGTVPLDREFGIDFSLLDSPFPSARAKLQSEIFQQVKKYESRATIAEISFNNDPSTGKLNPTVKIEVNL